jgi:beta-galactosidase
MDIGDYAGAMPGEIYAFTNADEVRLYKNNDYVSTFVSRDFEGMKHGPVLIDDTIGELLETKEGFGKTQAAEIRECMLAAGKYGFPNLPVRYKAMLAYIMLRYSMTFSDGYDLYGRYVGNWGGEATVWRFDAVKDGKVTASVVKTPGKYLHLETKVSSTVLREGETYDMSAVRISVRDENGNPAVYAQLPVQFETEGPIEIAGPKLGVLEGGMSGLYVRTVGRTGKAVLTIRCEGMEEKRIEFEVTE